MLWSGFQCFHVFSKEERRWGGGTLLQDRTRQEAEYRAPQDVLERVLK